MDLYVLFLTNSMPKTNNSEVLPVYLDCNATTPVEPAVQEVVRRYALDLYGNAGSRTHVWGAAAKKAVENAREQIASLADCEPEDMVFTSGATEACNLAILGLRRHGEETNRRHCLTTSIEHKAVLEPFGHLYEHGFDVETVPCGTSGRISAEHVLERLRDDTLLISVMQANNETGVLQPIEEIAEGLAGHPAWFHCDAAQGFGKDIRPLRHSRIDMASASAHKVYGPKGVGALILRRRDFRHPPLEPLMFGGGQELGLRPGSLPVPLIAGFGEAARLAQRDADNRAAQCRATGTEARSAFEGLDATIHGDPEHVQPHVMSVRVHGVDAETVFVAAKDLVAISNGSACTSGRFSPSHVLRAMGIGDTKISETLRLSWSHLSMDVPWRELADRLSALQAHTA